MDINDKTLKTLQSALQFREMRQKIISANIANSETPGYKAKRLDFEDSLRRAIDLDELQSMQISNSEHFNVGGGGFNNLKPEIYEDPNGVVSESGNTVDREKEMALMTENQILYDAAVQLINKKLGLRKYVLSSER